MILRDIRLPFLRRAYVALVFAPLVRDVRWCCHRRGDFGHFLVLESISDHFWMLPIESVPADAVVSIIIVLPAVLACGEW